jgi:type I restriction enzyme R subunit
MAKHNEDTRVKLPAILHLVRLGYTYLSLKDATWDESTNIFPDLFKSAMFRVNPELEEDAVHRLLQDVSLSLENEDLGHAFYDMLMEKSGTKLIDWDDFDNNTFHVVTELTYKNGDEEFRPDIILLINGMPLSFIEVKKPNNPDGVLAERKRINTRFANKKFRKFVNLTQIMMFSNNMEYDELTASPVQGAFYGTPSYDEVKFNFFREEEKLDLERLLLQEDEKVVDFLLADTNYPAVKNSPEFLTNKNPNTPTNRLSTSLFSRERLSFLLQYAITYVKGKKIQKHIMRYPQIFATKAIERKLDGGMQKGIIWHTQGSGKTALAYYNVKYLTDYYQKQNIIPKFYFIVDRLDLLTQAKKEFLARGLVVHTVSSKSEFAREIKKQSSITNKSGKAEITVVNIQKFSDDAQVVTQNDYSTDLQRIYFLDEVHRSYNPKGSFLANLTESDKNAITIGLTGTPRLDDDYNSKKLFDRYIHKYYYNASIADGYTLRLIREEIETNYKITLQKALEEIEVLKGNISKREIYAHHQFVEPMLEYILKDFKHSRQTEDDETIGAMVVCDSSDQAKMMYEIFQERQGLGVEDESLAMAAENNAKLSYGKKKKKSYAVKTAQLILHDIGTKEERKAWVEEFKDGKIDILFVYNMLLTGFDAPRLKKLYLGRIVKDHNLLQTLTRVNRTYKSFYYGYVVDFADISAEFDKTNKAYFDELQSELGDEMEHYSNLFKSKEEIEEEIAEIKEVLWEFDTENAELFSQQISEIQDIKQMQELVKVLGNAKSLYNLIRLYGHYDLLDKIDFQHLSRFYIEARNHLNLLNLKKNIESKDNSTNLLNVALEDIIFMFTKVGQEELLLADKLKDTLRKTREELAGNFDQKDPEFITLKEELERLFKKKNLSEVSQEDMKRNIGVLNKILEKVRELNRKNNRLKAKYKHDEKYARIHKRLSQRGDISKKEMQIFEALKHIKDLADLQVLKNTKILDNEEYFDKEMIRMVIEEFKMNQNLPLNVEALKYINGLVVKEYMNEFNGVMGW